MGGAGIGRKQENVSDRAVRREMGLEVIHALPLVTLVWRSFLSMARLCPLGRLEAGLHGITKGRPHPVPAKIEPERIFIDFSPPPWKATHA